MSYYIINKWGATLDLGTIHKERYFPESDLDEQTFPTSGSKQTQAYDYGGVRRHITLTGTLTATSIQALVDKALQIDALQNGDQGIVTFHSDLLDYSTYTEPQGSVTFDYTNGIVYVKVKDFDWGWDEAKPLAIIYTLTMFESI
jgi:hypothetical protein